MGPEACSFLQSAEQKPHYLRCGALGWREAGNLHLQGRSEGGCAWPWVPSATPGTKAAERFLLSPQREQEVSGMILRAPQSLSKEPRCTSQGQDLS